MMTSPLALVSVFLCAFVLCGAQNCGSLPSTFEDGKTPTAEIHVAVGGTGTGTAANPYGSIQQAINAATPGTAVRIHAGSYAGGIYVSNIAGTEAAPIWIGGAPGEARPVIGSANEAQVMQISRGKYLVVHDLEGKETTANGINCDDGAQYNDPDASHHIIFRNLYVHDVGTGGNQDCLKLSGINDYMVLHSTFSNLQPASGGSCVDHVGCHRGIIAFNNFTNCGSGVQSKGGSEDIEIRWNHFKGSANRALNMGGSTGFEFFRPPLSSVTPNFEAKNIRAISNTFQGDGDCPFALVGCVDCVVSHNTVIEPLTRVFRILQETVTGIEFTFLPASNGMILNNILAVDNTVVSSSGRMINVGTNTEASSFSWSNNLWFATNGGDVFTPAYTGGTTTGEIYNQDPLLLNVYEIPTTSPAASAGIPNVYGTADIQGNCYGSPPSIGAFEPNSPSTTQTSATNTLSTNTGSSSSATATSMPATTATDGTGDLESASSVVKGWSTLAILVLVTVVAQ